MNFILKILYYICNQTNKIMNGFTKIGMTFATICFFFFMFMTVKTIREEDRKLEESRVWVNKEHTACHFQDTLEVNGVKYLKVYDKDNSGLYGDPYLVPVK